MIQRIQSVYLLLASGAVSLILFKALAKFFVDDHNYILSAFRVASPDGGGSDIVLPFYMGGLAIVCLIVPLICIFFYKNRMMQIRLCIMEMVFLAGLQAFVVFYLIRTHQAIADAVHASVTYRLPAVMPLVAILLTYLAMRAIMRDEAKVRSIDRIR